MKYCVISFVELARVCYELVLSLCVFVHAQNDQRESAFSEWLKVKKEQKKKEEKMKQMAKEEEVTEGKKVHTKRQCERAFRR